MARDIVLVSFDFLKSDYDYRSYAISSILASLKKYGVSASHYFIDIHQVSEERLSNENFMQYDSDIEKLMRQKIDSILEYLKKFHFIAIAAARWSKDYVKYLVKKLREIKYNGKIICGSYEVTATDKYVDLIENFGDADYFIKGYAEKPIVKLIKEGCYASQKVINEPLDSKYLASPYQEGIIPLYSRKIYWETKRGCKFSCGFCEWGNREHKDAIDIDEGILKKDIDLFSNSNIEEINILDGTFNIGDKYFNYLSELLEKTDCRITFQARFEAVDDIFLDLCEKYKERVHLEFGLQTIHKKEMEEIERVNDMERVENCLKELNKRQISYEVSIIYAIPGQTIDSFIDSIEFLKINGCKKIRAFPLQIPNNFDEEKKKNVGELQLDKYKIESVANSYSFTKFDRGCMDIIAGHLNEDDMSDIRKELETNGRFVHLMKMIDSHKTNNKISICDGREYVYKIDNDVLEEYENYYFELFRTDYINQYFKPTEIKSLDSKRLFINSHFEEDNYYKEIELPAEQLQDHIEKHIRDIDNKSIKLTPVIRIGKSGDFYVYAKARYFIGGDECSIINFFRSLSLKDWEKIKPQIEQYYHN